MLNTSDGYNKLEFLHGLLMYKNTNSVVHTGLSSWGEDIKITFHHWLEAIREERLSDVPLVLLYLIMEFYEYPFVTYIIIMLYFKWGLGIEDLIINGCHCESKVQHLPPNHRLGV